MHQPVDDEVKDTRRKWEVSSYLSSQGQWFASKQKNLIEVWLESWKKHTDQGREWEKDEGNLTERLNAW